MSSKLFNDDVLRGAQQVWSTLDDMYANDPKSYKRFMDKIKEEAFSEKRPVKGVYSLECQGTKFKESSLHFINICETDKIDKAKVEDKITVVVSQCRKGKTAEGVPYRVYDAVVHSSIIQEAQQDESFADSLIQLALDCIEKSFTVTINRPSIKIHRDAYIGPYGWDEMGRPVNSNAPNASGSDHPDTIDASKMTPTSLLTSIHAAGASTAAEDAEGFRELPPLLPKSEQDQQRGIIEELHDFRRSKLPKGNVCPKTTKPKYTMSQTADGWVFDILLPGIESASKVLASVGGSMLEVCAGHYSTNILLPKDADSDSIKCKFFKKRGVLKIVCAKGL